MHDRLLHHIMNTVNSENLWSGLRLLPRRSRKMPSGDGDSNSAFHIQSLPTHHSAVCPSTWAAKPNITMPLIVKPDNFAGDRPQCQGFRLHCQLYFTSQEGFGPTQDSTTTQLAHEKGAYVGYGSMWERGGQPLSSYECFITLFNCDSDHALEGRKTWGTANDDRAGPGTSRRVEFALEFRTLAAESGWNDPASNLPRGP